VLSDPACDDLDLVFNRANSPNYDTRILGVA
jgi:hypothetical protein